jgi:hypothetical protein
MAAAHTAINARYVVVFVVLTSFIVVPPCQSRSTALMTSNRPATHDIFVIG